MDRIEQMAENFNQGAEKYDEQRKLFIPCFDDFYGLSVSFLKKIRNNINNILELGVGTGLLTKYLYEKYPNADYTLIDVAEQMLEIARQRFEGLPNFQYLIQDYSRELPQNNFDLVASALSIHHLEEDDKLSLYSNIYSKLENGGCLLNLDFFNASSDEMNRKYNDYWCDYVFSRITPERKELFLKRRAEDKENTIDETKDLLTKIGFRNVECIYNYMKFGVILAEKA
jgi:ubiquinone/menaquinone biosynthesis C-methylase UbiE